MQSSTVGRSVDVDESVDVFVVVDVFVFAAVDVFVFAVVDDCVVELSDGGLTVKKEVDVADEDGLESGLVEMRSFEIILDDDDEEEGAEDAVEPVAAGSLDVSESNAVSNSEVKVDEELCVVFAPGGRTAGVVVWSETCTEPPQVFMHLR
jgi:hypothetical protein